jgi:[ribosomal protein S5]-alanine N-acetyltransferase
LVFPVLETRRLRLDSLSLDDADRIFELFSNRSVVEYYDVDAFTELSQAQDLITFFNSRFSENSGIRWAIRLTASNQLIGTCGFNSWNVKMRNAVIGYDLLPEFWGSGFASEAVHQIIKSAFSGDLPCGRLHRIQGDTVPGNKASEALLIKAGFKEEGLRRQCGYWKNQYHDLKCFGLIRTEFGNV